MTALGQLVAITKGRKPLTGLDSPASDSRRLIQIDDLRPNARLKYCPPQLREVMAKPTDVLLAWDGANAGTTSYGLTGVIGSTLARLRPHDLAVIHTPFLGYFLSSKAQFLRDNCKGATVPHLDPKAVSELDITLPALDEQRRIAAILDQADALRAKRRQVLAELDALTPSVFYDMFGDISAERTVEDVAQPAKGSIRTGPFGSQLLHSEFVDEGVAVLGLDNVVANEFRWVERRFITDEKYKQLSRYTVHPGDVLISIMGTTGRCVVVPRDIPAAINTKHICAITLDPTQVLPDFVRAAFLWHSESRRHLLKQTKGSVMDGLNMGIIRSMPLPVPPLNLQLEFAARVSQVATQRLAASTALTATDEIFASVQARAFSGQL